MVTNKIIVEIYLYYSNLDFMVGHKGSFSSVAYYLLQGFQENRGYEKWLETLASSKGVQIRPLDYQEERRFCYIHSMTMKGNHSSDGD